MSKVPLGLWVCGRAPGLSADFPLECLRSFKNQKQNDARPTPRAQSQRLRAWGRPPGSCGPGCRPREHTPRCTHAPERSAERCLLCVWDALPPTPSAPTRGGTRHGREGASACAEPACARVAPRQPRDVLGPALLIRAAV